MSEPMNDGQSTDYNDFIKHLKSLSDNNSVMSIYQFMPIFRNVSGTCQFKHLEEVANFASNQAGYWEAEYLFSFAHAPNKQAKSEADSWIQLIENCMKQLSEIVSDKNYEELTRKIHNFTMAEHLLKKRIQYNAGKPFLYFLSVTYSKVSFFLNKVGLRGIAIYFHRLAMYPNGTVGRVAG